MFAKRAADVVLKSPLHAGFLALCFYFLPLFGFVSYLISCFVALRLGARAGFIVMMWAVIPVIALMVTHRADMLSLSMGLANYMALWLLALVLRFQGSWAVVLKSSVLLSGVIIIGLHGIFGGPALADFWKMWLNNNMAPALSAEPNLQAQQVQDLIAKLIPYWTGGFVAGFLVFVWTNLMLSRYWQAVVFNPGGLKVELGQLRLGIIMVLSTLVVVGLVALKVSVAQDVLPVLLIAWLFAGVCFVHTLLSGLKNGRLWLVLFYVALVLSLYIPWLWGLLLLIVMLDSVVDVKRFIKSKGVL